MAFKTGMTATITIGGTSFPATNLQMNFKREVVRANSLNSIYETHHIGRISYTATADILVDDAATNAVVDGFQGQSALGSTAAIVITDQGSGTPNVYTFNAYITSASHTMTSDNVQVISVEMTGTGSCS